MKTAFPCTLSFIIIFTIVFICERSSFWEVVFCSVLDILDSTVKANESVFPKATVEAYDYTVVLKRSYPQVYIVTSFSS